MIFENRFQAGVLLSEIIKELPEEERENALILAIPRGGVEVAYGLSKETGIPFSLVIVRKLGIPWNEEAAFGSVDPDGKVYLDESVVRYLGLSPEIIESVKRKELERIKSRIELFLNGKEPPVEGKSALVVDDGMATGYTTLAALSYVKRKGASKVISLSPVCPEDTCNRLKSKGFEVYCYHRVSGEGSFAVGMFYKDFHQLSDGEVIEIIKRAKEERLFYERNS